MPAPGAIEAWWASGGPDDAPAAHIRELLDARERERARAHRAPAASHTFVRAHALLRLVLAAYVGEDPAALRFTTRCRLCGGSHGKPSLIGAADLDFSLSHSHGAAIVAVGGAAPIGVDIENRRGAATVSELSPAILAPGETLGRTSAGATGLLRHWTRKEALLKATGHGLAIDPSTVRLMPAPDGRWHVRSAPHLDTPGSWTIIDATPGPDHVAAIALKRTPSAVALTRVDLP